MLFRSYSSVILNVTMDKQEYEMAYAETNITVQQMVFQAILVITVQDTEQGIEQFIKELQWLYWNRDVHKQ